LGDAFNLLVQFLDSLIEASKRLVLLSENRSHEYWDVVLSILEDLGQSTPQRTQPHRNGDAKLGE